MFKKGIKTVAGIKDKFSKPDNDQELAANSEKAVEAISPTAKERISCMAAKAYSASTECVSSSATAVTAGAKAAKTTTVDTVGTCFDATQCGINQIRQLAVEKNNQAVERIKAFAEDINFQRVYGKELYSEVFDKTVMTTTKKMSSAFENTFELKKDAEEIVDEIKKKQPPTPQSVEDVFCQSKTEVTRRAVAAFGLSSVIDSFDNDMSERYSNLSMDYKEYSNSHDLHKHQNFKDMAAERSSAKDSGTALEDGYNKANALDPSISDIEHVVPKKEYYDNLMIRAATDDEGLVSAMNHEENLVHTVNSVNRSKGSLDFREYLEQNGVPDPNNPDNIILTISGKEYVVNAEDCQQAYDKAVDAHCEAQIQALQDLGISVFDSAARIAIQQVVGLFIVETSDVFIDEIKDVVKNGALDDESSFCAGLSDRCVALHDKIMKRLEEKDVLSRAKTLGVDGLIGGAVGMIPMALISIMTQLPGFVFAIIRECCLSVLRAVRVLLSEAKDKIGSIQTILFGTVSAVTGVYLAQIIATAIAGIPGVNMFTREITEVLSAAVVTTIILVTLYYFNKKKESLDVEHTDGEEEALSPA